MSLFGAAQEGGGNWEKDFEEKKPGYSMTFLKTDIYFLVVDKRISIVFKKNQGARLKIEFDESLYRVRRLKPKQGEKRIVIIEYRSEVQNFSNASQVRICLPSYTAPPQITEQEHLKVYEFMGSALNQNPTVQENASGPAMEYSLDSVLLVCMRLYVLFVSLSQEISILFPSTAEI